MKCPKCGTGYTFSKLFKPSLVLYSLFLALSLSACGSSASSSVSASQPSPSSASSASPSIGSESSAPSSIAASSTADPTTMDFQGISIIYDPKNSVKQKSDTSIQFTFTGSEDSAEKALLLITYVDVTDENITEVLEDTENLLNETAVTGIIASAQASNIESFDSSVDGRAAYGATYVQDLDGTNLNMYSIAFCDSQGTYTLIFGDTGEYYLPEFEAILESIKVK